MSEENLNIREIKRILIAINRASGIINKKTDKIIHDKDSKMTVARWQLLSAVYQLNFPTISSVARAIKNSRQNVAILVNAMEKDNLLKLVNNPNHRKSKILQITEFGLQKLEQATNERDNICEIISDEFLLDDLQITRSVLQKLYNRLEK